TPPPPPAPAGAPPPWSPLVPLEVFADVAPDAELLLAAISPPLALQAGQLPPGPVSPPVAPGGAGCGSNEQGGKARATTQSQERMNGRISRRPRHCRSRHARCGYRGAAAERNPTPLPPETLRERGRA